jgi:copper resistance protein C
MKSRFLVGVALGLLAIALAAVPALAHTKIKSTSPKRGGTASTSISAVSITFKQQIRRGSLKVIGPGREVVSEGSGGRDPRNVARLAVGLESSLRAGRYKVRYTIVAADGHTQKGSFRFRLN